jgi:hypothetical protein
MQSTQPYHIPDYYQALIIERGPAVAAERLADENREKDRHIVRLIKRINALERAIREFDLEIVEK